MEERRFFFYFADRILKKLYYVPGHAIIGVSKYWGTLLCRLNNTLKALHFEK